MASAMKGIGKFLFGTGGSPQPQTPIPPPPPATPIQQPTGTAATNKQSAGQSFLAAAAPAPTPGNSGGKATLLGQ